MKQGWEIKKLGEVSDFQGGSQPPKDEWISEPREGYIRMLQIRDFTQSRSFEIEYVKISNRLKYCNEEDVLLGRYGASVGKVLTGLAGAYNVAIMKTIPNEAILTKRFFKYFLLSPNFQSFLLQTSTMRAAQAGFSKEDIYDYPFNLPQIEEQERIVAELDCLSGVIERKREQLRELDALAQSIFYQMFGDPITNEKRWEVKKLEELCDIINGFAFPSSDFAECNPIKAIKITNVGVNEFISDDSSLPEEYNNMEGCKVHTGDIVIALTRTIISTGVKRAIVPNEYNESLVNQRVAAILANDRIVSRRFLYSFLGTDFVRQYILQKATALMQPNLSIRDLRDMPTIYPPFTLQQEFADKIEAIEKQKKLIKQSITQTEELFNSRMDYYFN